MGARWIVVWRVVAAWLLLATVSAQQPDFRPFTHINHVPAAWALRGGDKRPANPEVWRDCRGCHRFDAQREVSAPQAQCDACHIGDGRLVRKFAPGWEDDLRRQHTRTAQAFRHHTHEALACRQCHPPDAQGFVPGNFTIRTGPGSCAECHEEGRAQPTSWDFLARPDAPDYATRFATVFGGDKGGMNSPKLPAGTEFDHADHAEGFTCVDCHDQVRRAAAGGVGVAAPPQQACGKCHQADAQRVPLAPAAVGGVRVRELWSLGTFAHADHYRFIGGTRRTDVANDAAYRELAGDGSCTTCHTYAPPPPGRPGRDFPFAAGKSRNRFVDCIGCHDGKRWTTGETVAKPLHDSTRQGGGWQACGSCHVFGAADFAAARPQAQVQRRRERTFVFPANVHPDVTADGIARAAAAGRPALADCATCHRARVPVLASRLERKPFRHATHLAAEPQPDDCRGCHPTVGVAATSAALAGASHRTYDLGVCAKCHWGGPVTELLGEGETVDTVPPAAACVEFSHQAHVTTAKLRCAECHALAADGGDVTTTAEALACGKCHDHEVGGPQAEQLFGEPVRSCRLCHGQGEPRQLDVPPTRGSPAAADDRHYRQQQTPFAGFAAGQFHPATGRCTECHLANREAREPTRIRPIDRDADDQLFAAHPSGRVHPKNDAAPRSPTECLRCHWLPSGDWTAVVNGALGTPEDKALRAAPMSPATRGRLGNERDGYPGTERAKG